MKRLKSIEVVTIGVCAALYAGFGYLTHLGIFAPVIGVVRFWPSVVVPAVFSILFGPIVGGVGAMIGIFISDMLIHGNILLSLIVGVPSNFLGFYLVGYIGRKKLDKKIMIIGTALGAIFSLSSIFLYLLYPDYFGSSTSLFLVGISLTCLALTLAVIFISPNWRSVHIASVIGLGVGSIWIGLGVWVFSKFFVLPTLETNLNFFSALGWFTWTYFTEIPFLLVIVPPILKASQAIANRFKPTETTDKKK